MQTPSMKPSEVWGSAVGGGSSDSPEVGCIYCLGEHTVAPLTRVYYWAGTAMCQRHAQIHVWKQEPTT